VQCAHRVCTDSARTALRCAAAGANGSGAGARTRRPPAGGGRGTGFQSAGAREGGAKRPQCQRVGQHRPGSRVVGLFLASLSCLGEAASRGDRRRAVGDRRRTTSGGLRCRACCVLQRCASGKRTTAACSSSLPSVPANRVVESELCARAVVVDSGAWGWTTCPSINRFAEP